MRTIDSLVKEVKAHRVFSHPLYQHWSHGAPEPEVSGAMFHQIQKFCVSTRPGGVFIKALRKWGWDEQASLLEEIVESESRQGPARAAQAGKKNKK